jgi:hypothetical protein
MRRIITILSLFVVCFLLQTVETMAYGCQQIARSRDNVIVASTCGDPISNDYRYNRVKRGDRFRVRNHTWNESCYTDPVFNRTVCSGAIKLGEYVNGIFQRIWEVRIESTYTFLEKEITVPCSSSFSNVEYKLFSNSSTAALSIVRLPIGDHGLWSTGC